ncbi:CoA transferase, partial [Xanthomonas citri pv. citri]|nr:CoA transferase [Xanthomonas citri pv. citri]
MNFKDPKDHERFMKLVEHADVVLENFRPGVTKRLGVDAESVHKTNPRIIYASISGFGQEGPFRNRPAYDLIVQAMSGIMAATGPEGGKPTRVGESLGDVVSGIFAGWAICAALYERERT